MNKLVGTKVKKKQESNNLIIIYLNRFFLDFTYPLFLFLIYRKRAFSPTKRGTTAPKQIPKHRAIFFTATMEI
jgi:hypothetical protein